VVVSLGWGSDLHMAQLMPLPLTISPVNPDWFYLSAHPGSPGQNPESHKTLVVVVVVLTVVHILRGLCCCLSEPF